MPSNTMQVPEPPQSLSPQPTIPIVYDTAEAVWQYKVLLRPLEAEQAATESALNDLGREGWELTAVCPQAPNVYLYFKRRAA